MCVRLLEANFPAVASACGAEAGGNGCRFGFWSTTRFFIKFGQNNGQNRPHSLFGHGWRCLRPEDV
jgi:hypothetical protein